MVNFAWYAVFKRKPCKYKKLERKHGGYAGRLPAFAFSHPLNFHYYSNCQKNVPFPSE